MDVACRRLPLHCVRQQADIKSGSKPQVLDKASFKHHSTPHNHTFHRNYTTAIMSDWIGPNVYRIENFKDPKTAVTVKDGSKEDGAVVVLKFVIQHVTRKIRLVLLLI